MTRLHIHTADPAPADDGFLVEVRNRFDGAWSHGFAIVETIDDGTGEVPRYRLRRLSDGYILPSLFSADERLVVRIHGRVLREQRGNSPGLRHLIHVRFPCSKP